MVGLFSSLVGLTACAITKPCTAGGDVSWYPPLKGNMSCYQETTKDGQVMNNGNFRLWDTKNHILLEGQFKDGHKDGLWTQFNEKGEKIAEKNFRDGVEISIAPDNAK